MSKAATRVLKLLGHTEVAPVNSSCGAEQEYFLVDAHFAHSRPDLLLTGRTLFGKPAAKGQQFDDHYFGAIPERVQVFMQEVEERMYRLGIPAKTRHNEVAPGQFEIAPFFEAANVASDHQQLIMTLLKSTAKKHGFVCLLHEKPFAGLMVRENTLTGLSATLPRAICWIRAILPTLICSFCYSVGRYSWCSQVRAAFTRSGGYRQQ